MPRFVVFTVFISFFVALPASAQFVRTHSVVLLPIVIEEPIAGAFGSEWVTEIVARNTANVPVRHFVHCPPNIQCLEHCCPKQLL
jgi:hypothetical protein